MKKDLKETAQKGFTFLIVNLKPMDLRMFLALLGKFTFLIVNLKHYFSLVNEKDKKQFTFLIVNLKRNYIPLTKVGSQ